VLVKVWWFQIEPAERRSSFFQKLPEGLSLRTLSPVLPVLDVEPPHLQTGALVRGLRGKQ